MATQCRLCVCSLGLLLLVPCALSEKFSLSGSPHPVVGIVGQDVVLPCQLSPAARLPRMDLWWRKIGTGFIPVHEYSDVGPSEQPGEGYQNRTELFRQEFSNGNISLKLKRLQVADAGTYHCFVRNPEWSQEATTELRVAAVAPLFIDVLGPRGQGIGLACRSAGWFPKPELQWVGKNQLNRTMESVTNMTEDEENLYSVVSHVTVTEDTGDISCIMWNGLLETKQQSAIHLFTAPAAHEGHPTPPGTCSRTRELHRTTAARQRYRELHLGALRALTCILEQRAQEEWEFHREMLAQGRSICTHLQTLVVFRLIEIGAVEAVPNQFWGKGFYSLYFLTEKKSGGWRPILDLRNLSRYHRKQKFRMVTPTSIFPALNKGDWFMSLDL
ncbi:butyrophilin subfamily 3 member A2-like [Pelodiscus sinensis]|uniref:butyrophilin subfamily 3 member A2-like n=1 Tax=Pelodiscus sinensis TaxID=13735 RepID=UPI003F6D3AC6